MSPLLPSGGFSTGRGGGFSLGPSPNVFGDSSTADRAAAETLRDTQGTNDAAWLALYSNNRNFLIQLVWDDGDVLQRRNAAGDDWEDATLVVTGPRGSTGGVGPRGEGIIKVAISEVVYTNDHTILLNPAGGAQDDVGDIFNFQYREDFTAADEDITITVNGGTTRTIRILDGDSLRNLTLNDIIRYEYLELTRASGTFFHLTGRTLAAPGQGVKPYAKLGGGDVPVADIPAAVMLDSEFTAAAIRTLLGFTAAEQAALFTGATITNNVITFTQEDGSTIDITVPVSMGGMADGVVSGGSISADGMTLTLTRTQGGDVTIDIPALLRAGGGVTRAMLKDFAIVGERGVQVGDMDSESATDNQVPTSDGSGGVAWEDQQDPPAPPATDHFRYFGWKAAGAIVTADLDATLARTNSSQTDEGQYPANDVQATRWFAVPESEGVPTEHYLPPNPLNTIIGFTRQAGTIDDGEGEAHIVMVASAQTPITANATNVRIGHS